MEETIEWRFMHEIFERWEFFKNFWKVEPCLSKIKFAPEMRHSWTEYLSKDAVEKKENLLKRKRFYMEIRLFPAKWQKSREFYFKKGWSLHALATAINPVMHKHRCHFGFAMNERRRGRWMYLWMKAGGLVILSKGCGKKTLLVVIIKRDHSHL